MSLEICVFVTWRLFSLINPHRLVSFPLLCLYSHLSWFLFWTQVPIVMILVFHLSMQPSPHWLKINLKNEKRSFEGEWSAQMWKCFQVFYLDLDSTIEAVIYSLYLQSNIAKTVHQRMYLFTRRRSYVAKMEAFHWCSTVYMWLYFVAIWLWLHLALAIGLMCRKMFHHFVASNTANYILNYHTAEIIKIYDAN